MLVFECLAERTIALAHLGRLQGTSPGFDPLLLERMAQTMRPARSAGTVVITNGGAAAPAAAARAVRDLAAEQGAHGVSVAAVTGDDVLETLDLRTAALAGGGSLWDLRDRIVSANAYLGAEGIVTALEAEADIVIAGRTSDAALFLAPLLHRFGWARTEHDLLAAGTLVGHLLECAGQLTGGYFADGDRKVVKDLARLGFPYADVTGDGTATLGKLPGTGGRLDRATCLEQLLYEVHDPHAYLTPDVVLDVSQVLLQETAPDEVTVSGARGHRAPETLKVLVGVRDGFIGTGEISYAGAGCLRHAEMAAAVVADRWRDVHGLEDVELRQDFIGVNACRPWVQAASDPNEVRLRLSARSLSERPAALLLREVEALYTNGPSGGGGVVTSLRTSLGVLATSIPRDAVRPAVEMFS